LGFLFNTVTISYLILKKKKKKKKKEKKERELHLPDHHFFASLLY
jgi:hypothetical protein